MGAKRLKAVVARGDPPGGLEDLRRAYEQRFAEGWTGRWYTASETLESIDFANEVGALATRGWQEGRFEGTDDIGIAPVREGASGREHDEPVPGGFRVPSGDRESVPRGATPMTLGAGLGIDDFDAVVALGETCDRFGLDVISGGNAVAWTVVASREGLVDRDIGFGDHDAARTLIEEIATRGTELGDALAEGVEVAAETIGGSDLIPTVKGMEAPSYDPRGAASMALAYATSDRGACHRRARPIEREPFDPEEWTPARAATSVIAEQNTRAFLWSLVADDFLGAVLDDLGAEWLEAVGAPCPDDLDRTGERIWNLVRLFNLREGFTRDEDQLPTVFTRSHEGATTDDHVVTPATLERMLDAYYERRGWDGRGRHTTATLARLGLAETRDDRTPTGDATDPS